MKELLCLTVAPDKKGTEGFSEGIAPGSALAEQGEKVRGRGLMYRVYPMPLTPTLSRRRAREQCGCIRRFVTAAPNCTAGRCPAGTINKRELVQPE